MKNKNVVKPMKTWEKIMAAALIVIGLMLFSDTGRIEALLVVIVLSAVVYVRLRAEKVQS